MGLIDEILHFVIEKYQKEKNPDAFENAIRELKKKMKKEKFERVMEKFVENFPPLSVYLGDKSSGEYLGKNSNLVATLKEIILLFLANENPAFNQFKELFDDTDLRNNTDYKLIIDFLEDFFKTQPTFGPYNQNLFELLFSPIKASPNSLEGQLLYIKKHWNILLLPELIDKFPEKLLIALDFIKEEEKKRPGGPGPILVPQFFPKEKESEDLYFDEERFSPDTNWMPNVVMIAKHTYVWLYQLSKKYNRPITRLDQIPDEELEILSSWGFNAIWLIGIWERSPASAMIKKLCGNPEAIASAYSIVDYVVAKDLGGDEAFDNLKQRALEKNIRIAVDIVPNHTAIDSRWIKEHPDWFIQTDSPPFFRYSFNGPNLSLDPDFEIYIEDNYYTRTDAAVVFKFVERRTSRVRYIYHGNDGTSTPWNDTAQLNFLLPQVREAVIKKIIEIARRSSIIRLDAAMTLTKRHYQRLWFPEPGKGGDIPSRSEYSMNRAQFNKLFPKEFWREVVERVAIEAPDTLLLAEAFWLMEGYFVRNLGMHRVYNSAFMNMLKMEQNKEYHQVLKNILEFNPEILRRFVNFMSNPDELTAIEQFGKDDKYFGVCVLLATMPGLCMFAHGQIEGFREKYGMEYRRPYWDEIPDEYLINRHKDEIFFLLKKRYLFSGVENFYVYDFYDEHGRVNENVFAFSNRLGSERALVIYNNRYLWTRGKIYISTPFRFKGNLVRKNLSEGLDLKDAEDVYYIFNDHHSKLQFIYSGKEIARSGLPLELGAYRYRIFIDIKEVYENENRDYERLNKFLNNEGVRDIQSALKAISFLAEGLKLKEFGLLEKICREDNDCPVAQKVLILLKSDEIYNLKDRIPEILDPVLIRIILSNGMHSKGDFLRRNFFEDKMVKEFLLVHRYNGIVWFNKERFEDLISWLFIKFLIVNKENLIRQDLEIERLYQFFSGLIKIARKSEFRYMDFLKKIEGLFES
uniref:Alpha-amylase n=1 Tax=candidate division WOR-3 bacterium TaxID=2052148 RepID=A0A7C4XC49_UNCW3